MQKMLFHTNAETYKTGLMNILNIH